MLYDLFGSVIIVYVPRKTKSTKVYVLTDTKPIRVQQYKEKHGRYMRTYDALIYDLSLCSFFVVARKKYNNITFFVIKMSQKEFKVFRNLAKKIYRYSKIYPPPVHQYGEICPPI